MKDDSFKDFVLDQLSPLGDLRSKSMFGGHGLYLGEVFFGIIAKGRLYFKTNSKTRGQYIELGADPFMPGKKQKLRTYYEVPVRILEDRDALVDWARQAAVASEAS